ncbi:MAG: hypothetical protein LBH79_03080 [Nitrososphaerota archaeon]|nr:hypothetical protein [Nitrososphaerota archaeon]
MEVPDVYMMPFFIPEFILWEGNIYYDRTARCVPIVNYWCFVHWDQI